MLMLVTIITKDRSPLFKDSAYAREAIEQLYRVQESTPFVLYAFVIMWDHCHILLKVPSPGSISDVVRLYKMGLAFQIGKGSIWQPRFHIRYPRNPREAIIYIHRHPVLKGFVESPRDYPWSSASGRWDVTPLS